MEALLEQLLPRLLGAAEFEIICFQCKHDLLKKLPKRLKAYAGWLPKSQKILVLLDRDESDCHRLKQGLDIMAKKAGLIAKTVNPRCFQIINRIVVEELEAWFFGDWKAVRSAYSKVPENIPRKARFRDPDAISGGTWEEFERVLKRAGYFSTGLRKLECARTIAPHMQPERNASRSFQAFREALAAALA
ncbi:MAG: DUF4276 family protein [Candidatus Accumulibacter sp.]|nr:DUF4276 family protein [Accumulibacter sp.]